MDHKITIQRINFVISIPIEILLTTTPFVIEIPLQQHNKTKLHPVVCKNHHVFF